MSDYPLDNSPIVRVEESRTQAESVMMDTAVSAIKSILGRLGVEYSHGSPKEVYVTALQDTILENKDLILLMVPDYIIGSLMEIWEEDTILADEELKNYLEYLKILGFAWYDRGNPKKGIPARICFSQKRKDEFYFYLRSRSAREEAGRFAVWEKLITGLMYYYGFLEMKDLYEHFLRVSSQLVPYELFISFLKCRCSLWAFGEVLKDIHRDVDYFSCCEVDNKEMLLLYIREHRDVPYKLLEAEDLIYVSEGAGIDNRWPGIQELGTLLANDLGLDFFKVTVHIRTLLRMIRNGNPLRALIERGDTLPLDRPEFKEAYETGVRLLYEHVPVFEYKGYSHSEYRKLFFEEQLKKKTSLFTIIDGGKAPESE